MYEKSCAPTNQITKWREINFSKAEYEVRKLQVRIAKSIQEKRYNKAKALQWTLVHSFYAKAIAIKRVTENKGKKTPGVDGVCWNTDEEKFEAIKLLDRRGYHPQPLRRIYIPKKNGKKRPLSIPTMKDRAMQTLYKLALEPVAETLADESSMGFRPKRCVQDAIELCFTILAKKSSPKWILEGDIKGCFDNINHEWMIQNLCMDSEILRKFLKAGFIEDGKWFDTKQGTPQGGAISPTLCNMTLDGLNRILKKRFTRKHINGKWYNPKIHMVRYADDFIITGESKEVLENEVQPLIIDFMKSRGLELSSEKTVITNINDGFNFLGCNIRKYGDKLLTKPSKDNVKTFLRKCRGIIKGSKSARQRDLIKKLNPIIRGWVNFHKHNVSTEIFKYVDYQIFEMLWKWAKRRHKAKNAKWIKDRYFHKIGKRIWTFSELLENGKYLRLEYASDMKIIRHTMIKLEANPYDTKWNDYFVKRAKKNRSNFIAVYE
ncbi:MAG: group II intron reverse transcriptase/maturase [Erysipelotrichaceae bacterium]|nr:group II intron reverse transcriptase/maturase [Erysipelotrichaceae bacterium]